MIDPDPIDRVRVQKVRTSDEGSVQSWNLSPGQTTGDIDLEEGNYFVKLVPYIDPLPVWFKLDNKGDTKLDVQCILSYGTQLGFKTVDALKPGKSLNIPGCQDLEYRVLCFSMQNQSIINIDGIRLKYYQKLAAIGIRQIKHLAEKDLPTIYEATKITVPKLAEFIRKAEILCATKVSPDDFETIGDERIIPLLLTPIEDLVRKTGKSKGKVEALIDQLENLTVALDAGVIRKLQLKDLFE